MSEILTTIKEKGFWRIIIRPIDFESNKIKSLVELRNIIEQNDVKLRGWNYPHFDYENINNGNDFVESFVDFAQYKEMWRYYQSGQFIHFRGMREDYDVNIKPSSIKEASPTSKYFAIIVAIYTIAEIFEFTSRLATKDLLSPSFELEITLNDTFNRQLMFYEPGRHLMNNYRCNQEMLSYSNVYDSFDFVKNYKKYSSETAYYFFERFNWLRCPMGLLQEEQNKLFEKRI